MIKLTTNVTSSAIYNKFGSMNSSQPFPQFRVFNIKIIIVLFFFHYLSPRVAPFVQHTSTWTTFLDACCSRKNCISLMSADSNTHHFCMVLYNNFLNFAHNKKHTPHSEWMRNMTPHIDSFNIVET